MISVTGGERFDLFAWTEGAAPPESNDPENWALLATEVPAHDPSGFPAMGMCFWGHLREEHARAQTLPDIAESLHIIAEVIEREGILR